MSFQFKCNTCQREFTLKDKTEIHYCPWCASSDVAEKKGRKSSRALRIIMFVLLVIILIAIAAYIIKIWCPWCNPIKIKQVNRDDRNCRLTVVMERAPKKGTLKYSFDNGKSFQMNRSFDVEKEGVYIVVVKDDKMNNATWQTPLYFSKNQILECWDSAERKEFTDPPLITSFDKTDESGCSKRNGQIIIHCFYGEPPIFYSIDTGRTYQTDSIFHNLKPGKYKIQVLDSLSRISAYFEEVNIEKARCDTNRVPSPSRIVLESKLNRLFVNPDNRILLDSINKLFVSESMNVDCELIGIPPNTPYQLYQFLQRRYEGKPGSKHIQILEMKCNNIGKINSIKIREIPAPAYY